MAPLSKDDIILLGVPTFSISLIKRFFVNHEVKVNEDEEELIGDETDILKVVKVKDDGNNKVQFLLFRLMLSILTLMRSKEIFLRTELRWS